MFAASLGTPTEREQHALEQRVERFYREYAELPEFERQGHLKLRREVHIGYLQGGLEELPAGFVALDASRPWIVYWILHSLALLEAPLPRGLSTGHIMGFLRRCQHPHGGYGGGPQQLPHLAPTYAAVCSLVTLGGEEALASINRAATLDFLQCMCNPPEAGGGFTVCEGGEVDVRGCYTAMAVAHLLRLDKADLAQRSGMVDFVQRCQTYEGGLGGEPWNEAHGGYTFCGLAALMLVDSAHVLDLPRLLHWVAHCQGSMEGGFMGRTNKLVDGCYSFWQGALFPLLQRLGPACLAQTRIPASLPVDLSKPVAVLPPPPGPSVGPVQQAQARVTRLQQEVVEAMKQAHAAPAASQSSDEEDEGDDPHAAQLLSRVSDAEQACARAMERADALEVSAAMLCSSAVEGSNPAVIVEEDAPADKPPGATAHSNGSAGAHSAPTAASSPPLYHPEALQLWLLQCCQLLKGGLRDKPGKPVDYYHTCYCLSGLAVSQHSSGVVLGPPDNVLQPVDPVLNVVERQVNKALNFYALPS